jgi:hypothetical protein
MPFVERSYLAPALQSRRSNNQVIETNRVIVSNVVCNSEKLLHQWAR